MSMTVFCQHKIDSALQRQIKVMFKEDQKWRIESDHLNRGKKSEYSETTVNAAMAKADSLNMITAKRIIQRYGFPGYSLVGEDGSGDFWAIIQHCDNDVPFQQRVLTLMGREVRRNNASGENYALLQDRVLVNTGHKQLYGTQVRVDFKTHHAKPLPIQDSLHVDAPRTDVGLATLKEYLKFFEK